MSEEAFAKGEAFMSVYRSDPSGQPISRIRDECVCVATKPEERRTYVFRLIFVGEEATALPLGANWTPLLE